MVEETHGSTVCATTDRSAACLDVTVVIPAFNEAPIIEDCLRSVICQTTCRTLEIIVVANGCTDDTAARARRMIPEAADRGIRLLVLEQDNGNKPQALNLADRKSSGRARIYMDADIRVSNNLIEELSAFFTLDSALLCSARLCAAPTDSIFTRSYLKIWTRLPVVRNLVVGAGLYAVSAAGRARWNYFPELISDDKFVRLHFKPHEQFIAYPASYTVQMPDGLVELVRVRSRWSRGNRDLRKAFPALARTEPNRLVQGLRLMTTHPKLWPFAPAFVFVFIVGEILAVYHANKGLTLWERADRARAELGSRNRGGNVIELHSL